MHPSGGSGQYQLQSHLAAAGCAPSVIPLPGSVITNRRIAKWLDAQHQYRAIAQRARQRPALHVVAATRGYAVVLVLLAPSYSPSGSSGGGRSSGGGSGSSARPRWSRAGSSVVYTPAEVRALTPVRESVENLAKLPDLRDVFLCHAWDDRQGAAKELHDLLESRGV